MELDYTIVIPVFNKAALTRHCLETLRATLDGAGEGETIVIDNASSDHTQQMLADFPWVRVVRNDVNRGFAGANNQGAQLARGRYLVLLNNDTEAKPGWLARMLQAAREPGVGVVGARLLFPNGTLQHAGVAVSPLYAGKAAFIPFHDLLHEPGDHSDAVHAREYQIVTGACLVTPRDLYLELGGLDEAFWNGYEDVDYCLKVRERGLRVVYEGRSSLIHFESQSGVQRFRKVAWNCDLLADRWNGRVQYDALRHSLRRGSIRRIVRQPRGRSNGVLLSVPPTTILCHGDPERRNDARFAALLRANDTPVDRVLWASSAEAVASVRAEMEVRGDRYLALVDTRAELFEGWLDELVRQVEWGPSVGAAAFLPERECGEDGTAFTADARCTLLSLRHFPQHERLGHFTTLHGALADFLIRAIPLRAATRTAAFPIAVLPPQPADPSFERAHGMTLREAVDLGDDALERELASGPRRRTGLVSIVMLSWNAPQFTKIALESIRAHTSGDYEIIIVDNGSKPETVEWLRTLDDVHVIYNAENRGFAGGNNQAMAAARGEYVVLLNNDVVVTDGWLEGLLSAFDRVPRLGMSALRSNKIAGDQVVADAQYATIEEMHAFAARRRERYRGHGYLTDRAIGLCLCIDRRAIEEIGGIDERFGAGNYEDDDFSVRMRAAGYRIHVCDDVFIHHYGSQTFAANNLDYNATLLQNWAKFARKWGLPPTYTGSFEPAPLIRRGFVRADHYVALPAPHVERQSRWYDVVFAATVCNESDWNEAGAFLRRYLRAFGAGHSVLLAIAAAGDLAAQTIGMRAHRIAQREGLGDPDVPDVEIADENDPYAWFAGLGERIVRLETLRDRSPSGLRRMIEGVPA